MVGALVGDTGDYTLVLLGADTVAGWRQARPSLAQLGRATSDLIRQYPGVKVAVVADPSIKWALEDSEHDAFEGAIVERSVVCAPQGPRRERRLGGCGRGPRAYNGEKVAIVTDQAIGGVPVARPGVHRTTLHLRPGGGEEWRPAPLRSGGAGGAGDLVPWHRSRPDRLVRCRTK
ncbi:MAG: hypothetical protein R2716_03105 [Microthrixaceae bacterium]